MQSKSGGDPRPIYDRRTAVARAPAFEPDYARLTEELERRTLELEQSRARFRDVIERNADAIVVVDREGVIRFANGVAAQLFRTVREQLVGTPLGYPMVAGETTELDLPHPDGARVVEMRVVGSEWEGVPACIASLRDITERKRAEEGARRLIREQAARAAAEAAAQRFRFLAEASTVLSLPLDHTETLTTLAHICVESLADWVTLYLVDDRGTVQRLHVTHRDPALRDAVEAMRALPISPHNAHPVFEVLRTREPLLIERVDDERLRAITEGERHLDLARQLGVCSIMLVPLIARDRELGAIAFMSSTPNRTFTADDLAVANDLALRAALAMDNVRLYHEAHEANQAKSSLLAVISHDLRTPLNSVIGHAELLAMGIPEPLGEAALQRVERIRMSATHLVYLIDELLSFARLDGGHEELRLHDLDARMIIREVAAVVEPLAQTRGLQFDMILPEQSVTMSTDADRLRQILLNVVGNAIKYTDDGYVRLVLSPAEEEVQIDIADSGIGIDGEHIERIFEPFWQVNPQRNANGGTGLGLSVVRRLARLLGGDVTVVSKVGDGSTFTLRLPRMPRRVSSASATQVA